MPRLTKETLAIVHTFHKFDQFLFSKADRDVVVHGDHTPSEIIFKRPLADAPRRLQSIQIQNQNQNSLFIAEVHLALELAHRHSTLKQT